MCAPPFGLEIEGLRPPAPGNVCLILHLPICNVTLGWLRTQGLQRKLDQMTKSKLHLRIEWRGRRLDLATLQFLKVPAVLVSAFDRSLPCAVLWVWP